MQTNNHALLSLQLGLGSVSGIGMFLQPQGSDHQLTLKSPNMMFSLHTPASLYTTNCKTRREQRRIRKYDSRSSHQRNETDDLIIYIMYPDQHGTYSWNAETHHPTATTGIGSHTNDWPKEGSEQVAKSFPVCGCATSEGLLTSSRDWTTLITFHTMSAILKKVT